MKYWMIAAAIVLTIGLCVYFSETNRVAKDVMKSFEQAESVKLEKGQKQIVLDQTAVFGIPKGYKVADNSYYNNVTATNKENNYMTNISFESKSTGNRIDVSGWPRSDSEQDYPHLKEVAGKDPDIETIRTPAGEAFFYYSGVNKDGQPLGLAAYIRIGSNTYCIEMSNLDDDRVLKKDEIAEFKEYVQSIEKYSGNDSKVGG